MQTFKYLSYRDLFQIIIDLSISAILIPKFVQLTLPYTNWYPTRPCPVSSYPIAAYPILPYPILPYLMLPNLSLPYLTLPYPIFIQHHPLQSTTLITLSFSFSKVLDQMKNQWYHLLNMIRIVLRFWELWSRHLVTPSIKFVQSLQCDAHTFRINLLLTHCWFSDSPFISFYRFVSLFFLIISSFCLPCTFLPHWRRILIIMTLALRHGLKWPRLLMHLTQILCSTVWWTQS